MTLKFWKKKRSRKLKKDYFYYIKLTQKAVPLCEKWNIKLRFTSNLKEVERILNHMRRIAMVQQGAVAKKTMLSPS